MSGSPNAVPLELSALPIAPGQIIAERYRVGEVLGGGGMGVVCAGTHVLLGTPVAIKLIHSELKDDHEAVQRFVNEARATAALKGEHIARVFDVGLLETGEPFLVMEQLDGVSLDQYLHGRGALGQAEAIAIVLQVCEGLAEAHAAALVHRDIKPGNLFLARRPDGLSSVKILDFGIAKQRLPSDSPALTNPGKSLGSPWYMSPEQMLTPASVDERADVWSIGVLLFELLTARVPFDGESVPQVCANVLGAVPPPPSSARAGIAPELDAIVLRCLEKEPQRRFRSVSELAQALLPFASADAALALPEAAAFEAPRTPTYDSLTPINTSSQEVVPRRAHRRGWPLATALVAAASLLVGAGLQYRNPSLARRAVNATRIDLPGDPRLSPSSATAPLQRETELVGLLQTLRGARAVAEPERSVAGAPRVTPAPRVTRPVLRRAPAPVRAEEPGPAAASWKRVTEDRYGL